MLRFAKEKMRANTDCCECPLQNASDGLQYMKAEDYLLTLCNPYVDYVQMLQ